VRSLKNESVSLFANSSRKADGATVRLTGSLHKGSWDAHAADTGHQKADVVTYKVDGQP